MCPKPQKLQLQKNQASTTKGQNIKVPYKFLKNLKPKA